MAIVTFLWFETWFQVAVVVDLMSTKFGHAGVCPRSASNSGASAGNRPSARTLSRPKRRLATTPTDQPKPRNSNQRQRTRHSRPPTLVHPALAADVVDRAFLRRPRIPAGLAIAIACLARLPSLAIAIPVTIARIAIAIAIARVA